MQVNSVSGTDWRDMTSEQWDKLVSNFDEYIDYYKAELEQREIMINKATEEAVLKAPVEMRAQAASRAALMVAANGHSEKNYFYLHNI